MPIDLTIHKKFRYVLFSGLYFSEGLYYTILMIITPLYLVEKGVSVPTITLIIGIGNLPWIFKFVWGGVIDYFIYKGRKIFTIYGSILSIICLILIALFDFNFYIILYTALIVLGYIGICFLDASADAWVIDITKKEERGKMNGSMNIGRSLGVSIGAIILTFIADIYDYRVSFLIAGFIIFLFFIFPLLVKKGEAVAKNDKLVDIIKKEFKNPLNQLSSIYFFLVALNPGLIGAIIVIYANIVLKLSTTQIGLLSSALLIFIIPGSMIGGILTDKYSRKRTLFFLISLNIIFSALLILTFNWILLLLIYGLFSFVAGGLGSANSALMMDISKKKIGATQFSIYSSIFNAGFVVMAAIGGTLIEVFDFSLVFISSSLLLIPPLFLIYLLKRRNLKIIRP